MIIKTTSEEKFEINEEKRTIAGPGLNGQVPYAALVRTMVGAPLVVVLAGQSNFRSLGNGNVTSVLR